MYTETYHRDSHEKAKANGDKPAMPYKGVVCHTGVSKREHFAGLALQGLIAANPDIVNASRDKTFETLAETCVDAADALLMALELKE